MTIVSITDTYSVSGEICAQDLIFLHHSGVSDVINVRPDNEVPDQIPSAEWSTLCQQNGLKYFHIPVKSGHYCEHDITQFKLALAGAKHKVHCFCRTGTRAAHLFALANKDAQSCEQLQQLLKEKGYSADIILEQLKPIPRDI